MKRIALAVAMLAAMPAYGQSDPRIREVAFRPGTVYTLRVVPGYVATVVLSPDERIQSVAIGNSSAWDVTPSKSGDHLFIRPLGDGSQTNVELVTDSRHYSLILKPTFEGDPEALFQMRFDYGNRPQPSSPQIASAALGNPGLAGVQGELPPQPDSIMSSMGSGAAVPAAASSALAATATYRILGDRLARPLFVSDDGQRTLFAFDDATPLPAIYAVDEQGQEILVTIRQVPEGWAVDRIWPEYTLRLGKAKARAVRQPDGGRP